MGFQEISPVSALTTRSYWKRQSIPVKRTGQSKGLRQGGEFHWNIQSKHQHFLSHSTYSLYSGTKSFYPSLRDFIEKDLSHVKEREISLPMNIDKVVSIVGMRRTGKTFLLFLLARKLRDRIPKENVVYLNFEDDRLFPLELRDMDLLVQAYYELFPGKKEERVYFLFDEIQNVPNWETFIRRLQDTEKCHIYITGSSSRLLGREIATALRGRTVSYEVFPLSLGEFLTFKGVKHSPIPPYPRPR